MYSAQRRVNTGSQELSLATPPQIWGQVLRSAVHQDADQSVSKLIFLMFIYEEKKNVHLVPRSICPGSKPLGKE